MVGNALELKKRNSSREFPTVLKVYGEISGAIHDSNEKNANQRFYFNFYSSTQAICIAKTMKQLKFSKCLLYELCCEIRVNGLLK